MARRRSLAGPLPLMRFLSGGERVRWSGKTHAPQQLLETRIVPQIVHARVYMKIDKPVAVFCAGFLQILNRAIVVTQTNVYSGEEMGRDIPFLCQLLQIIEDLSCFLC